MKTSKKVSWIFVIVLVVYAFFIILNFGIHAYRTYLFNHVDHRMERVEGLSEIVEDCYTFAPRGGSTDSWVKRDIKGLDGVSELTGTTYDINIYNAAQCDIRYWTFRMDFKEKCYLNKAWCGEIEVHQNVTGNEIVQKIDLRNFEEADVILDYVMSGQDILIPLNKGDYIIYYPNEAEYENLLLKGNGYPTQKTFGIILYSEEAVFNSFDSFIIYNYGKSILQGNEYFIAIIASIIWILLLVIFITIRINSHLMQKQVESRTKMLEEALSVFTRFVDAKDPNTHGHSLRVAEYSKKIAEKLGFDENRCIQIYHSALLHDCGKCYIDDAVLKKPDRLSAEEYEIIKIHTTKGAEMLKNFSSVPGIADGALYHHERYDGTGYPYGKKGEEIPFIGRLICVADAFDVMNSSRCYKEKLGKDEIVKEIENNKGSQFDPAIADVLLELINDGSILDL